MGSDMQFYMQDLRDREHGPLSRAVDMLRSRLGIHGKGPCSVAESMIAALNEADGERVRIAKAVQDRVDDGDRCAVCMLRDHAAGCPVPAALGMTAERNIP